MHRRIDTALRRIREDLSHHLGAGEGDRAQFKFSAAVQAARGTPRSLEQNTKEGTETRTGSSNGGTSTRYVPQMRYGPRYLEWSAFSVAGRCGHGNCNARPINPR